MEKVSQYIGRAFKLPSLENVEIANQLTFSLGGINLTFNITTIIMTWIVIGILLLLAYLGARRLEKFPGRAQAFTEWVVETFDNLVKETLGEKIGRKFLPLIATLFFFVCLSNWLGSVPTLKSPTSDLNTTLGLAIMVFLVAQTGGILKKGPYKYFIDFFGPVWWLAPLMFPLNIIGEVAKVISHSFRLFGNILGGGLVILVISELLLRFLPTGLNAVFGVVGGVALNAFFGLFVGAIQALVFSFLALAYINVARD